MCIKIHARYVESSYRKMTVERNLILPSFKYLYTQKRIFRFNFCEGKSVWFISYVSKYFKVYRNTTKPRLMLIILFYKRISHSYEMLRYYSEVNSSKLKKHNIIPRVA